MRKKITVFAVILCLCCSITTFAAETSAEYAPQEEGVGVYGKSQGYKNYYEITLGANGMDTVELPNEITLGGRSDNIEDNGLVVVIIPVLAEEDAEAYTWVVDALSQSEKEPIAYYMAFYYKNKVALPKGNVTITMSQKKEYANGKLHYMDGNANAKDVNYTVTNEEISFIMEKEGYYVLTKPEKQEPDGGTNGDGTNGSNPDDGGTNGGNTNGGGTNGGNPDGGGTNGGNTNGGGTNGGNTNGGGTNGGNTNGSGTNGGNTNGSGTNGGNTNNSGNVFGWKGPQTGDENYIKFAFGICIFSIGIVAAMMFKTKKNK